jgi:hypothetical protein
MRCDFIRRLAQDPRDAGSHEREIRLGGKRWSASRRKELLSLHG